MHEKTPTLGAIHRERIGSRYAKRERSKGRLPAVVYGHGQPPVSITVPMVEAIAMIHKGEKLFNLDFPGLKDADEGQLVLLRDLQFDYLGTNIVHCDFARVDLNERVHTKVHISLVGEAIGLKTAGAIFMHPTAEIEIECRVADIPDSIEVNISSLDMGQSITAGEVKLPLADMKLLTDPHAIVAQVVMAGQLVEASAEAGAVTAEGAQPEVITAKKEEGAEGAAAAPGAKGAAPAKGAPAAKGAAAPAAGKGAAPAAGKADAGKKK